MDRVCPLLALAVDRRTAVDGVDGGHRCHALVPPASLERERQSQLCLTPAHQRCERYLAHLARTDRATGGEAFTPHRMRSTRLLLTPEPSWRGMAGRARRSPRGAGVVALIAVIAVGGATAVAAGITRPRQAAVIASPSQAVPATATATATPRATATPASLTPSAPPATSPVATPIPSVAPTAVPATVAPTPQPTAQRTHVVQAGDTLALIAQQFGVSVTAIQAANGIEDANEIVIGQVLVIP